MTPAMKILVVSAYFESHRGGVELVAARLARELAAQGGEVRLLACAVSPPPPPREAGVRSDPLLASNFTERHLGFPWPLPGLQAFKTIHAAVAECDVVLAHDALYPTTILAYVASRLLRRPLLIVQHVGEIPYKSTILRWTMRAANALVARPLLARADQVVFISATTAAYFSGIRFKRPPEQIFNGVDHAVFAPPASASAKAKLRRDLGLPADRPVALFVGRFVEKKGLDLMARLARTRSDIFFAFAGWGQVDPEQWGAPNVAVFRDRTGASLADLYRAADVFLLPSVGEGFPLVIQEALACGLPVVCGSETTRADAAAAAHLRGVDLTGSAEAISLELGAALDAALAEPITMAKRRTAFARNQYAWSAGARRYMKLLESIASET